MTVRTGSENVSTSQEARGTRDPRMLPDLDRWGWAIAEILLASELRGCILFGGWRPPNHRRLLTAGAAVKADNEAGAKIPRRDVNAHER